MWEKPSDAAAEAAVWGLIEAEAKKRKDEARQWLTERMGPDLLAVKAVANGDDIGRASYVEGKREFKVVDQDAFTAWVARYYPTEAEEVLVVNAAFQKRFLSEVMETGGEVIDEHGVIVDGVELRQGNPYVSVSKSKDAREKVAALLSGGGLSLDGIKVIEGEK